MNLFRSQSASRRQTLVRSLLGLGLASALALPSALANSTSVTINANVQSFVVLRLETASGTLVSDDDLDRLPSSPAADEVLDFGNIDQLGSSAGSLSATNAAASGTLTRHMYVGSQVQPVGTLPVAANDGAVYHVDAGYQLRALRNDGASDIDVDVDVTGATALNALVATTGSNTYTSGTGLTGLRTAGAAASDLIDDMPLNTAQPLDLGVLVPLSQTAGTTSTVITFTGS